MEELAVMGIVEVSSSACRLLHIRADLEKAFWRTEARCFFVGIDAPDFNITLEGNPKSRVSNHSLPSVRRLRGDRNVFSK
jgi:lipid-A-disaccharide synthase